MVALHERFTIFVAQDRALAAKRFRKKKAGRAFDVQRRGMKLDEFDVVYLGSRAPGHGDAVAGGNIGIGCFLEYAAQPTSREKHRAGADITQNAGLLLKSDCASDAGNRRLIN